jgi:hypothetical protein
MLIHKTWTSIRKDYIRGKISIYREGWFLFWIIPIYIRDYRG